MKRFVLTGGMLVAFASGVGADPITMFGRTFDKSFATYGSLTVPPDTTENPSNNAKFEVYIRPSLTVYKFSDTSALVAYTTLGLIQDSEKRDYDNKVTLEFGAEMQHRLSDAIRVSYGAQYKMEREFSTGTSRSRFILTADANLYKTWQPTWVKTRLRDGSELVLSGWANYRYPESLHISEKDNGVAQAALKLAVSMPFENSRMAFAPFASLKVKADHKGRPANNIVEPALGIELKIPFKQTGEIAFGAKSAYQWRHAENTASSGVIGYIKWYKSF